MGGRLRGAVPKGPSGGQTKSGASRSGSRVDGWLVVSMCQIASVSLLAMSIWATLAPRWRPRRSLVLAPVARRDRAACEHALAQRVGDLAGLGAGVPGP
jgi:hypothetical protein